MMPHQFSQRASHSSSTQHPAVPHKANLDRSVKLSTLKFCSVQNPKHLKELYYQTVSRLLAKEFAQPLVLPNSEIYFDTTHHDQNALLYAEIIQKCNAEFCHMISHRSDWNNKGTSILKYIYNIFHDSTLFVKTTINPADMFTKALWSGEN